MHTLSLNRERTFNEVILRDKKTYKIPSDFTVAEVERMLENSARLERLAAEPAANDGGVAQVREFIDQTFHQLEIIFQHYQPEVTSDYLRNYLSQSEALELIGFHKKHTLSPPAGEDAKKKRQPSSSLKTSAAPSRTSYWQGLPSQT